MVIAGLVLAGTAPWVTSLAVTVAEPAVFNVIFTVLVPLSNVPSAGKTAFESDEAMLTKSDALVTRFQFASTALTVKLNAAPAICPDGEPILPFAVPGAAV